MSLDSNIGSGDLPDRILPRSTGVSVRAPFCSFVWIIRTPLLVAARVRPSLKAIACRTEIFSFVFIVKPPGLCTAPTTYTIPARDTLTMSPGYTAGLRLGSVESSTSFKFTRTTFFEALRPPYRHLGPFRQVHQTVATASSAKIPARRSLSRTRTLAHHSDPHVAK